MASSPITSWQIEGEKVEVLTDFLFLGSKITVDGDCSHKIKRCLLLGRKAVTNLDSICFQTAVLEKTLEALEQQRDQISQSKRKSALNIHRKN